MAAKKVNPELLGKLARIDAAQKAPKTPSAADFRRKEEADKAKMPKAPKVPVVPTTTVPPVEDTIPDFNNMTDEEINDYLNTISTTTTAPPVTTTTVPAAPKPYGKPNEKVNIMGMSVTLDAEGNIDKKRYPYAWAIHQDILKRESDAMLQASGKIPKKKTWLDAVGNVVSTTLNNTIVKPLNVIDAPRRVIISGIKEGVDALNAGDASWSDFVNQSKDVNFGFGDVVQTGNKWVDRAIGFVGDVALDPTTYLTLGTGTAAKMTLKGVGMGVSRQLIDDAAKVVVREGVEAVEERVAKELAKELGDLSAKELRTMSRAVVSEATQQAYAGAATATEKAAAKAARDKAIKRYTAVAPRRQLGAKTKEAMADGIRQLKDEALQEAKDLAGTASGRRAQAFADTITDDVISDIATRGYAGIRGVVAEQLGVKSGFRFGAGSRKVYLGGGEFADVIGKATAATRLKPLQAGGLVGRTARGVSNLTTGQGLGGLFGDADIWDWRTGLKQGRLTGEEGVRAVKALAEDTAYRAAQKASTNSVKTAFGGILNNKAYKPFWNTVHEVLGLDDVTLGSLSTGTTYSSADAARAINATGKIRRTVTEAEVEFARLIRNAVDGLHDDINDLAENLGGTLSRPSNWYPQTLDNRAASWLKSTSLGKKGMPGTSPKEVLEVLGLDRAPIAGDIVGKGLKEGDNFFGYVLTQADVDAGIARLNQIARDGGYKGNFFETNIASALNRYSSKFGRDYAFLKRLVDNALGDLGVIDTTATGRYTGVGEKAALRGAATSVPGRSKVVLPGALKSELEEVLNATVDTWDIADISVLRNNLERSLGQTLANPKIPQSVKQISKDAAAEFEKLLNQLEVGINAGLTPSIYLESISDPVYASTVLGIVDDYSNIVKNWEQVIARDKNALINSVKNLSPATLATMADLAEDAFVKLGGDIVPDVYVRADIAQFYQNMRRLKDPKQAGRVVSFMKDYTNTFKTWVTTTPGFHARNIISNAFQMIAAGGDPRYLMEARTIYKQWNDYVNSLSDPRYSISGFASLGPGGYGLRPAAIVDEFIVRSNMSKSQASAFREAILSSGAITEGDLADVFSTVTPGAGRTGFTGREIRTDISERRQAVSRVAGYLPAVSRSFGNNIENANRFMLTYDGIKQGYSPQEAAARTGRFLVDYEDLSRLDEVAKQIVPFWMWMSRNIPVQITNMYANPGVYQKYNNFRRNFQDEDGTNPLLPDWMKESGAFKLPFGSRTYARPDLGFPGTGSPSPLVEGVTDLSSIYQSMNPALRTLLEQVIIPLLPGQEAQQLPTGIPFESTGERVTDVGRELLSPASWLGRVVSAAGGAQQDLPGPSWLQEVLGVTSPDTTFAGKPMKKDPAGFDPWVNSLMTFLGIPLRRVGANEENQARRDYRKELMAYQDWLREQGK